jgi:hypothetical protein
MHWSRLSLFLLSCLALPLAHAAAPELLQKAADKWMNERDNWAFTLRVREFKDGKVKEERDERYDPSKPGLGRWQLLAVNGRPPTEEKRAEWQKRKTKKRKNPGKPLNEYLAFEQATVVKEDAKTASYHVPLRNNNSWIFPVDKVDLRVTVDKQTLGLADVEASTDEPFRVALGFAQVLDVDFDVQMNPTEKKGQVAEPAGAKPDGTAKVVLNKMGERVEYAWSDFRRVTPHPDNVIKDTPTSPRS